MNPNPPKCYYHAARDPIGKIFVLISATSSADDDEGDEETVFQTSPLSTMFQGFQEVLSAYETVC